VGVDAVICEGYEAGGHKGFTEMTSFVLIPMVADAVKIPVVAGGGIGDARGLLAALVLGADGAYVGTCFMMTVESDSHQHVKETVLNGEDVCTVSVPKRKMLAGTSEIYLLKNIWKWIYPGLLPMKRSDSLKIIHSTIPNLWDKLNMPKYVAGRWLASSRV
jgi:hypothetical protein